ncbi:MAG: LON peptidase substrate-binding domain-containing protein [Halioglobus sp.]|nr:LON peptidase substrate-binding domain-containing protein [Halioglobus sp.]MCB1708232.1 LON peptidase substrate-binding domain-containing protein [Halioglobus sp.]MCP5123496.1 LON peptidase substrate-binding domain-containing protein [Pseudomonadales bacterium]MCP5193666.1 LON peptidase substrate-binding domain-containing protein [Pseudomonadales bacterium]
MSELSLFPLSGVLMPFGRMPLQIFEQRYLDLVRDTMKSDSAFGVVWIRRGAEVAQRGEASPQLGDYGTTARIVDWDQLPNGLLGVTIQGGQRFDLKSTGVRANGLVVGQVELRPALQPATVVPQWQSLLDILHSLETHPHVQRMALQLDYGDAWQVACTLIQLLPLEEALKYRLLGIDSIEALMAELDVILNQISGED